MIRPALLLLAVLTAAGCAARAPAPRDDAPASGAAAPASPTGALMLLGREQLAAGNHPGAAAALERALRIEPADPELWLELARVRHAQGRDEQAAALARKALSLAAGRPALERSANALIEATARR